MASLFESLAQAVTPDFAGKIGKSVGLDPDLVTKGMQVAGPLVTGALASQASSPSGLDNIMKLLGSSGNSGLGSLVSAFTGRDTADTMLSNVFGAGTSAIGATLDKTVGFKVSSLLPLAAPFVLHLVQQKVATGGLDQQGVARLLQDEQATFARAGGPTAEVIRSALDAGKQAEATKAKYSDDSWMKLRLAPVAAAQLVMGASPSGAIGHSKELATLSTAITAARKDATPTSLVGLIFENALSTGDLDKLGQDPAACVTMLKEAVGTIQKLSPAEAAGYKKFLLDIATQVAESSKEGGFLGFGGTKVSAAEQSAIEQIRSATGA